MDTQPLLSTAAVPSTATETPVSQETPPLFTKKKKTNIGLLLFAAILVLFLLGAAAFVYARGMRLIREEQTVAKNMPTITTTVNTPSNGMPSSTPDPKADWRTYTNTKYSYSIQYPPTWTTQNQAAGAGKMEALPTSEMIEVFDANAPSDHTFEGIIIQALQSPVLPKQTKVINNLTVYVGTTQEGDVYTVKVPNMNAYLEITGAGGYTANESKNELIRQIFSTFAFLGQKQAMDKAGWKTYTSQENSFSLQYPTDKVHQMLCSNEEQQLYLVTGGFTVETRDPIVTSNCGRDGRFNIEVVTSSVTPIFDERYSYTQEKITVGGISATKYTFTPKPDADGPGEGWYIDVILNRNGKYYDIYTRNKEFVDLFNQILSTFQFTK